VDVDVGRDDRGISSFYQNTCMKQHPIPKVWRLTNQPKFIWLTSISLITKDLYKRYIFHTNLPVVSLQRSVLLGYVY